MTVDEAVRELLPGVLTGESTPAERGRAAVDLWYVLTRLTLIYPMRQSRIWFESYNHTLASRPIDVLALYGLNQEMLNALGREEQGAY